MKKAAGVVGLILVVTFLVLGFTSSSPDKYIKSYGNGKMYEYVGGDVYNYIIEASLRGGEIAGALTAKAIYFGVAGILFVLSISFLCAGGGASELSKETSNTENPVTEAETTEGELAETLSEDQEDQEYQENE